MNDYLTIKEVSILANTSYQNIYQRTNTSLKKYLKVIDGRKMLDKDVLLEFNINENTADNLNEIKQPLKEEVQPLKKEVQPMSEPICRPLHDKGNNELTQLVEELRAELKKKDEIIVSKDEQLKKQTEQIIDLSNRVVELFENSQKLQLQTSFLLSENNSANAEVDEESARAYEKDVEIKPKRKGLFSRFFK